jgi:uncharacterized membrane protein
MLARIRSDNRPRTTACNEERNAPMDTFTTDITVERPISMVYNQWTQFEDFPHFMQGVEKVMQTDDKHLHWVTDIGMVEREFDAEITEQVPDQIISWRAMGETKHAGTVRFEELGPNQTRIKLSMSYAPEGFIEKVGDLLNVQERRAEGDLKRFKEFIESRDYETGAWRGEIHK